MASRPAAIPTILEGTAFYYLAEGAANIVYQVSTPWRQSTPEPSLVEEYGDGTPPPSIIDDISPGPLEENIYEGKSFSHRAPCYIAQANWERLIQPLFPPHQLVGQALLDIQPGHIVAKLNEDLHDWENGKNPTNGSLDPTTPRPTKRQRIYLADDNHALLVKDMTSRTAAFQQLNLVEFKPKWLAQSPSAPQYSKRCRQCARMARINAERARKKEPPMTFYCPLDLTSRKDEGMNHVASLIVQSGVSNCQIKRFAQWLENTDILDNLKARQIELDQIGVLRGDVNDERLLAAMTLRDCTVFVKCTSADNREWEARIGDLDLKSKDKINYWRGIEWSLIEEGWYEGLEDYNDRQPLVCRLSRDLSGT
ncbi:hypothetical protein D0Z07_3478 [Hyphodiscus hymeniophilus]|uniref:Inositol-pentakisphosphate 2-kinase n=1 Tax=Hyphodiscus hymeniophilus TaxID=353542 RepID=A0A9P6VLW2_9HELO|nr:hypothetical protein D0Z07_3478 [Hyphodiscus hymeniophilus]